VLIIVNDTHCTLGTDVLLQVLGDCSFARERSASDKAPVDFYGGKDFLPVLGVPLGDNLKAVLLKEERLSLKDS
jgi:hypothetical protein